LCSHSGVRFIGCKSASLFTSPNEESFTYRRVEFAFDLGLKRALVKSPASLRPGTIPGKPKNRGCLDATVGYRPVDIAPDINRGLFCLYLNLASNKDCELFRWKLLRKI